MRDVGSVVDPRVAIALPTVPQHDTAALGRDGSKIVSDAGNTVHDGLNVGRDLLSLHFGRALSDVGSTAGSALHLGRDGADTTGDAARTAWDTGSGEVIHTLGDNAADLGNFVRNPLDQWPTGSAIDVPLGPLGPAGPLAESSVDSAAGGTGPSAQDLQFLKQHITGYSVTVGVQDRGRVEAGLGLRDGKAVAKAVGQPRLADNNQITITETLPQAGKPGTVSVTFANKLNLDARGGLQLGLGDGKATQLADPNIGSATGSVTLTWNLSAAQGKKLADAGHSLPVTELIPGNRLAHPDQLTTKIDVQGAAPLVLQNGKLVAGSASHETMADWSVTRTYDDPQLALKVLRAGKDPIGAIPTLASHSSKTGTELDLYDQHGVPTQGGLGIRINDVGDAKVWRYQQTTSEHRSCMSYPRPQRSRRLRRVHRSARRARRSRSLGNSWCCRMRVSTSAPTRIPMGPRSAP